VVVGSQWGDEGKGRSSIGCRNRPTSSSASRAVITPAIRSSSTAIPTSCRCCRPACCVPSKLSLIGNGVVLDPQALIEEIERLEKQGVAVTPDNLRVAENVSLILPLHQELDVAREKASGKAAIGTTGRGIGPAYEDKVGRRAIRLMDLKDLATLGPKIDRLLSHHNALRRGMGLPEIEPRVIHHHLAAVAPYVLPYMDSVWSLLDEKRREASASCSRARRARCSTSITALIPT
jgi:Adenylosuccinate synthase